MSALKKYYYLSTHLVYRQRYNLGLCIEREKHSLWNITIYGHKATHLRNWGQLLKILLNKRLLLNKDSYNVVLQFILNGCMRINMNRRWMPNAHISNYSKGDKFSWSWMSTLLGTHDFKLIWITLAVFCQILGKQEPVAFNKNVIMDCFGFIQEFCYLHEH